MGIRQIQAADLVAVKASAERVVGHQVTVRQLVTNPHILEFSYHTGTDLIRASFTPDWDAEDPFVVPPQEHWR